MKNKADRLNGQLLEETYHTLEQEVENVKVEVSEFITSKK
ncbi:hypothetical protein JCM19233_936 [Vibrio astriarenae]|nr:hypothetical protein JCM19233_936 [Vibrio sp. C7]